MPVPEGVMLKDDDYILMRCKIDEVFEHYAAQPEYYKRANADAALNDVRQLLPVERGIARQDYWAVRTYAIKQQPRCAKLDLLFPLRLRCSKLCPPFF